MNKKIILILAISVFLALIAINSVSAAGYIKYDVKGPYDSTDGNNGNYKVKTTDTIVGDDFKSEKNVVNMKNYKKAVKKVKNKIKIYKYKVKLTDDDVNLIKKNSKKSLYTEKYLGNKGHVYIPKFKKIDKTHKKFIGFKHKMPKLVLSLFYSDTVESQCGKVGMCSEVVLKGYERF